jgi:2-dehydropantoate 2-reductase
MPETRALIERSMHEIAAVARASNVALPDDAVARAFVAIDNLPASGTTSMQRDLEDGKPSELEHLVGGVVRLGERVHVPTPTMAVLYHTLLPRERRARGAVAF